MTGRLSLESVAVVTLTWVAPDGTNLRDYAPMFEVWEDGAQIHMGYKVEPGLKVHVVMEDGTTLLTGKIESCVADEFFGYIVEVAVRPKSVWANGLRRMYHSHGQGSDVGLGHPSELFQSEFARADAGLMK